MPLWVKSQYNTLPPNKRGGDGKVCAKDGSKGDIMYTNQTRRLQRGQGDPLARSRQLLYGIPLVAVAIAIGMMTNAANAETYGIGPLSPEQASRARETCAGVVRVNQGTVQFDACVESLSRTLSDGNKIQLLTKSYDDCMAAHHKDGTPEFAACVLDRKNALSHPGGAIAGSDFTLPANEAAQRTFSSSNADERRRKEEYACAQLGLSPGRASFGQCVTQLDVALWSVNNPS
jgi:hypothetical protein